MEPKPKKLVNSINLDEEAGQISCEAIQNIRTVLTLGKEEEFNNAYEEQIKEPHRNAIKGANLAAFGFGFSQGAVFLIYALAFYYASRLIIWDLYKPVDVLKVMFAIIFTAMSAGQVSNFAPNASKAGLFDLR